MILSPKDILHCLQPIGIKKQVQGIVTSSGTPFGTIPITVYTRTGCKVGVYASQRVSYEFGFGETTIPISLEGTNIEVRTNQFGTVNILWVSWTNEVTRIDINGQTIYTNE